MPKDTLNHQPEDPIEDERRLVFEVASMTPDDPRFQALLDLLFPDRSPAVIAACYIDEEAA